MCCSYPVWAAVTLLVFGGAGGAAEVTNRISAPVDDASRFALAGHVSSRLTGAQDLGPTDSSLSIDSIVLMLKPSDAQKLALKQLLTDLQNPASAQYHRWLTAGEYADRFGLSTSDIEKIRGWLESKGLQVEQVANGRNWIMFAGTDGQVASAFHTEIHRFQAAGVIHYANISDPQIPSALADVVAGIHGLTDFHPHAASRQLLVPHYIQAGYTYLGPADIGLIYNINPLYNAGYTGGGVSIAVIGQTDFTMSDITAYRSLFGLPANQPQIVMAGADPGIASSEDVGEAELDLEIAGGVAPNATIKFVNSRDVMTSALYAIDNVVAPIITMSYGGCEQESDVNLDTWQTYVQQANTAGITFFASSGDAGPFACDWNPVNPENTATHGLAVNFPASIPEVTAVGGTQVTVGTANSNTSNHSNVVSFYQEMAWNESYGEIIATGGGPSQHFAKPAWQNVAGVPADGFRDLPDIAFSAASVESNNPYGICLYGSCQSGSVVAVGGTSASSPVAAGILAILTQSQIAQGVMATAGLGNINPRLYQLSQNSPAAVQDVQTGSSYVPCEAGTLGCSSDGFGYNAGVGYDLTTGLGSLNVNELARAWNLSANRSASTVTTATQIYQCSPGEVRISATVSASNGSGTPTGTVYFYQNRGTSGNALWGSAPVSAKGIATFNATNPFGPATPTGDNTLGVQAIYSGDSGYLGAISPVVTASVVGDVGAITIQASAPSVMQGTPVQILGHVDLVCGPVTGQIGIYTTSAVPDASGNVLFSSSSLAPGIYHFEAAYEENFVNIEQSSSVTVEVANPETPMYSLASFAGTGVAGISGDGGPATAAHFEETQGIAVDRFGNTYIADSVCGCIRKVDGNGVITTFASSIAAVQTLAVGPDGTVYFTTNSSSAANSSAVNKIVAGRAVAFAGMVGGCGQYAGEGGPAISATICPGVLAVDNFGNVFIGDWYNRHVYKVSTDGTIKSIAGNGGLPAAMPASSDGVAATAAPIGPEALATDSAGNLYVASSDEQNYPGNAGIVYEIKSDGLLHIVAGGGTAVPSSYGPALAQSIDPTGIAVDANGNLFLAQGWNAAANQIFEVSGGVMYAIAGSGALGLQSSQNALVGNMEQPYYLAADQAGNVYLSNSALPAVQILRSYSATLSTPLRFVPVTPCRVADTRLNTAQFGGTITAQTSRDFLIPQSSCGIPATAQAYSLNVTAVPKAGLSYLTLWPTHQPQPFVSLLNSDGRVKANAAITRAGDGGGVTAYATDETDLIIDINGYFDATSDPNGLAFYPLAPCRIADTRDAVGQLGGPIMTAGQTRSFPVQASPCGIPTNAQAYSLNITVVPNVGLDYLSTWPAGQSQPVVSTLNSGHTVTANAAIVPAGTGGAIMVYTSDATDVVIDVDGYFAAPATNGLSLYTTLPCRPFDTRAVGSGVPVSGTITANIAGGGCGVPATASAFVLNATVIPPQGFGYLTLWPNGQSQPLASTLNAFDGAITSNMAVVPTTNGEINAFGTNLTQVVLDLSGYFAP